MDEAEKMILLKKELEVYNLFFEKTLLKLQEASAIDNHPIFVLHQGEIRLGMPILNKDKQGGNWNIHLSTIKEFEQKELILPHKSDHFKQLYQKKNRHYCLFVLSEYGAQFVFLPRVYLSE